MLKLTGHMFSAFNEYEYSTIIRKRHIIKVQFWKTVFTNKHNQQFNTKIVERLNDEADEP